MEYKERLQSKIRKHKEIVEQTRVRLENETSYLKGLEEAYELLQAGPRKRICTPTRNLRRGSLAALAFEYLKEIGKPQDIDVILKGVGKTPTRESRSLLARSLRDHVTHNRIFTNPTLNIFGLLEFEQVNNGNGEVIEEVPEIPL